MKEYSLIYSTTYPAAKEFDWESSKSIGQILGISRVPSLSFILHFGFTFFNEIVLSWNCDRI